MKKSAKEKPFDFIQVLQQKFKLSKKIQISKWEIAIKSNL